jgi:hypothetical protein
MPNDLKTYPTCKELPELDYNFIASVSTVVHCMDGVQMTNSLLQMICTVWRILTGCDKNSKLAFRKMNNAKLT